MPSSKIQPTRAAKFLNLSLLAIVMILGFVSFLSMLELLLSIGALVIYRGIESEFRQHYALVMLRNIWLVAGAIIVLCVIVGCSYNFGRRLGERRALRWPMRILALELVVMGLTLLITGRII